ncbi:MAG: zinc ribbon domain-containing protein [Nitrosopumilaceae archaeon]
MDDKQRCQSCGMPIGIGFYGTNYDQTANKEYCKYCFENGEFREPNLKMEDMMGRSVANMIDDLNMNREKAEELASTIIPTLKRWKK